ncbi:MAG: tryptophan synthase subunit alpha [Candidatus Riflebacteria bacterium]|nr:tryptophan synthase subunit alpha [Candidatus Riflebacteria bacterium]
MNRIDATFRTLGQTGARAFIPFLPLGFPTLETSGMLLDALERAGSDLVELGVPFSDSLADGPVIQSAYHTALAAGVTVSRLFDFLEARQRRSDAPLVLMCCYNLIHRMGIDRFLALCARAGLDGVLVPDLPIEESGPLRSAARGAALALVNLVAPNTPVGRARRIARASAGFVYYVSRRGTTGVRESLDPGLEAAVRDLKTHSRLPVVVGFGISTPDQAAAVAAVADGVVVGSAIVRSIQAHLDADPVASTEALARRFKEAVRPDPARPFTHSSRGRGDR